MSAPNQIGHSMYPCEKCRERGETSDTKHRILQPTNHVPGGPLKKECVPCSDRLLIEYDDLEE